MSERKSMIQIHHRGDRGVDGILRLIELAGHDGGVERMLTAMCVEIAAIAGVDVASVYVVEDDRLVMRGNHGFPEEAIGKTSLVIGEGITGMVAECMRPISAAHAAAETAYKHVPGLGEERYPVFVGVPLIGGGAAIGVLVLQRRKKPFDADEVTLATALGAPVTLAIERRRATAMRSARLAGSPQVRGAVLGRAAVVPTSTALDGDDTSFSSGGARIDLERAFGRLRDDLGRAMRRLADAEDPATGAALDRFALHLCDARLRERLADAGGTPRGLRAVAREYAKAPYRLNTASGVGPADSSVRGPADSSVRGPADSSVRGPADSVRGPADSSAEPRHDAVAELEQLCVLLCEPPQLRPGAVWIGDRISPTIAIIAVARGASALVSSDAITPAAIAIARAGKLPAVADVAGLFGWIRPGDLLAVDGATGEVLVHPAADEIERLRRAR